jgi:hypothetical protein
MTNDHSSILPAPAAGQTTARVKPVVVGSGGWFGFRWRRENASDHRALYVIVPTCRIGIVAKVATDGTPWRIDGRRYFINASGGFVRIAVWKYAVGIMKRPLPNNEFRGARRETPDVER